MSDKESEIESLNSEAFDIDSMSPEELEEVSGGAAGCTRFSGTCEGFSGSCTDFGATTPGATIGIGLTQT